MTVTLVHGKITITQGTQSVTLTVEEALLLTQQINQVLGDEG